MRKILIYVQDVGGAQCIAPVVKSLAEKYAPLIVVHPLSEALYKKHGIVHVSLLKCFQSLPVSGSELSNFLGKNAITHIFCTLSSPYIDLTNCTLIQVARKRRIPAFGVLDHWKGFERFYDETGKIRYVPDMVGCIDDYTKNELLKIYPRPESIFVVGHPYLEFFKNSRKKHQKMKKDAIDVLIVSQPDKRHPAFRSVFLIEYNGLRLVDVVLEHIRNMQKRYPVRLHYRAHPKEENINLLPDGVGMDVTEDATEAINSKDIFIGYDSIFLVQAYLAGKTCIAMIFPEAGIQSDHAIPYNYCRIARTLPQFQIALKEAFENVRRGVTTNDVSLFPVDSSFRRCMETFEHFIGL